MLILILVAATLCRNRVWSSVESLWSDSLQKSPDKDRVTVNYAVSMINQGRYEEAIYYLNETLRKNPRCAEAMNNLGMIYVSQGRVDEAEKILFDALKIRGSTEKERGVAASAHNNLGVLMLKKGAVGEALWHFKKAVELHPDFHEAEGNLKLMQSLLNKKSP